MKDKVGENKKKIKKRENKKKDEKGLKVKDERGAE